jgi:hypothetical protein
MPEYSYEKPLHSTTCKDLTIPELDHEMAWLLGLIHGDGYVYLRDGKGQLSIATEANRPEKLEFIINNMKKFGANPNVIGPKETDKCYRVNVSYKQLADYLFKNFKQPNTTIKIPEFIKNGTIEIKVSYLQGVIDADGYIAPRNQQIVTTVYEEFAKDLQSLLYSVGIVSRFKKLSTKGMKDNWQPKYGLFLLSNKDRKKFNNISKLSFKPFIVSSKDISNSFPMEFFKKEIQECGIKTHTLRGKVDLKAKQITKLTWEKFLGETDITPIKFKRIEDYEECETYDIEVEDNHNFICEGILVHNSATICLFSPDDLEMGSAKTGDWFINNPQRARSNNSALIIRDKITREEFSKIMENVKQFGEPGFILADSTEICLNPCSEIGMWPVDEKTGKTGWAFCNLCVINIKKAKTKEDFFEMCRISAIIGTLQAGYDRFDYLGETTENIVKREALLGCSITGMMDNPDLAFNPEVLKEGAEIIKRTNKEFCKLLGINPAARTTAIKPEGTSSCVLGTASGIHPHHYKRYFRRTQVNKLEEPLKFFEMFNSSAIEESVWSANNSDKVITFLIEVPKHVRTKVDVNAIELLEKVKLVQQYWVETGKDLELCTQPWLSHNVSNTINVKADEWDQVEEFIYDNRKYYTGISMLAMEGDKDYNQAPFQAVYDPKELVEMYGDASMFASGLIVHAQQAFDGNLYAACDSFLGIGEKLDIPNLQGDALVASIDKLKKILDKSTWIERAKKFTKLYFEGDKKKMCYCLKDISAWKTWVDLKREYSNVPWEKFYEDHDNTKVQDTVACGGGKCEIL